MRACIYVYVCVCADVETERPIATPAPENPDGLGFFESLRSDIAPDAFTRERVSFPLRLDYILYYIVLFLSRAVKFIAFYSTPFEDYNYVLTKIQYIDIRLSVL